MDYVPAIILEQTAPPPQLRLTKYHFKPRLEQMQSEYDAVRALGSAALEEWFKGLESRGDRANLAAARFDRWELQGGLSKTFEQASTAPAYAFDQARQPPSVPMALSAGISVKSSGHSANATGMPSACFSRQHSFHDSPPIVWEQTNASIGRNSTFILSDNIHRLISGVATSLTVPASHPESIQTGLDSPSFHALTPTPKKRAHRGGCRAYED
jgi:hypothetical protein